MGFSSEEADRIRACNDSLSRTVVIRLLKTEDGRSAQFEAFCEDLREIAPRIQFKTEEEKALPALLLQKNWRYHALPRGKELRPFLDLLTRLDRGQPDFPEATRAQLSMVEWSAHLKIYVAPQCAFCPQVLQQIQPFPQGNPQIHLTVIDAALFPELSIQDGVRSVPTLILDDHFRWVGSIKTEEVLDALNHRDPLQLSARILEDFLKDGNAERLAGMMLEQGKIFPAFLDLIAHPEWSVRLGAMVVLEEMADRDRELARKIAPFILERLDHAQETLKGDLIYALGLVGSQEAIPVLERLWNTEESPEIRVVLEETLEKLQGNTG